MKLDPQAIPELPAPRPKYEIWVYSPRVEGVHLRFGKVARGGLRWSDRREDFRTEVLGLVKAQEVKNSVIVPVGAKGGFVGKQLPDPAADRDAWQAEGIACYRTFISGLLDVTDNLVSGGRSSTRGTWCGTTRTTPISSSRPTKGTARFSDIANEVAESYGYWLGDAFASGGSAGYDHKGMGITARGAWVSVERHFRELGHNTQTEDFTVVGVGDMSGDVFGNGMLLSEHIRLVAAFDHRHIFLDPDPDAATSYAERRRLFELPRSSWADYDSGLISQGGGIHPRSAKSVPITPQVREALGIEPGVTKMTPAELMRAILTAPVDLLWNGGIGTYVKASSESDADVGDKANDAIRVDGQDLRVKVVGEGGNLGCTQLGRIEFALNDGRINTDAIDNSAGVDTSDHEVNIKILLNSVVAEGDMTVKQRNALLAEMTDEVGMLVLRNNYAQNAALANSLAQAASLLLASQRQMRRLSKEGKLDRPLEFLPSDRLVRERRGNGQGLTQPEIAVMLAYTKINITAELIGTSLPDDPYLEGLLYAYFPEPLRERFGQQIAKPRPAPRDHHHAAGQRHGQHLRLDLRPPDDGGVGGLHGGDRARPHGRAGHLPAGRHLGRRRVAGQRGRRRSPDRHPAALPAAGGARHPLAGCSTTARSRWSWPTPSSCSPTGSRRSGRSCPSCSRATISSGTSGVYDKLSGAGVPSELALRLAGSAAAFSALDVVAVEGRTDMGLMDVAEVYFDLADRLGITQLQGRVSELPRADRWQSMARSSIREDLYAAHQLLTADVLAGRGRRRVVGGAVRGVGGEEPRDPRPRPGHPGRDPGVRDLRPGQPLGGDADDAHPAAQQPLTRVRPGHPDRRAAGPSRGAAVTRSAACAATGRTGAAYGEVWVCWWTEWTTTRTTTAARTGTATRPAAAVRPVTAARGRTPRAAPRGWTRPTRSCSARWPAPAAPGPARRWPCTARAVPGGDAALLRRQRAAPCCGTGPGPRRRWCCWPPAICSRCWASPTRTPPSSSWAHCSAC